MKKIFVALMAVLISSIVAYEIIDQKSTYAVRYVDNHHIAHQCDDLYIGESIDSVREIFVVKFNPVFGEKIVENHIHISGDQWLDNPICWNSSCAFIYAHELRSKYGMFDENDMIVIRIQ